MTITKQTQWLNIAALICAVWFALFGMVWIYAAAMVIAYPVGIAAIALAFAGRRRYGVTLLYKIVIGILIAGFVASIIAFLLLK